MKQPSSSEPGSASWSAALTSMTILVNSASDSGWTLTSKTHDTSALFMMALYEKNSSVPYWSAT
jgi:hypothetical protein